MDICLLIFVIKKKISPSEKKKSAVCCITAFIRITKISYPSSSGVGLGLGLLRSRS